VLKNDSNREEEKTVPVYFWLFSNTPWFVFQENWLRIVVQNLEPESIYEYLFSKQKQVRTESDISSVVMGSSHHFPKTKNDFNLYRFLLLISDLENDDIQEQPLLQKSKSFKKSEVMIPEKKIRNSLINLIMFDQKPLDSQLLYISSSLASYLNENVKETSPKRNIRSMPMKYESLQHLNLNYPLVPDNHNYLEIFDFLSLGAIVDMFYGILLEERILVITDQADRFSKIVETIFELVFPFSPISYKTVSYLPEDMEELLGLPWPFVIGCTPEVFSKIQKTYYKNFADEIMLIQISPDQVCTSTFNFIEEWS